MIKALVALAAIVAGLVVVVAMQLSSFAVERSTAIRAPADIIYSHEGPEAGVGASSSWDGPKVGRGRMTITAEKADQKVDIRLEFLAPMRATNRAIFALTPADNFTRVTWRMEGTNGFIGKAFALVMNMDKTVGGDFEKRSRGAEAPGRSRRGESHGPVVVAHDLPMQPKEVSRGSHADGFVSPIPKENLGVYRRMA